MARERNVVRVDTNNLLWKGGLGVLLGIFVLVWPDLNTRSLITLVSIWLFTVGVLNLIQGVSGIGRGMYTWMSSVLLGLLELGVGAYLIQRPEVTNLTIVTLVGAVFAVQGLMHLFNNFVQRGMMMGQRVLSMIFAVLSVTAGIWLMRYPLEGGLEFVWLLGVYALASGALLIAMGVNDEDA